MKIYSNAQFNNPFAQYVGKNVWIKVKCLYGTGATIYIRVLEDLGKNVSGDHFIRANWIKSADVGRLRANTVPLYIKDLRIHGFWYPWRVPEPILCG